jgi:hypothetical protein
MMPHPSQNQQGQCTQIAQLTIVLTVMNWTMSFSAT